MRALSKRQQARMDDVVGRMRVRPVDESMWATLTHPPGAHWNHDQVAFGVYSAHATQIVLELFDQPVGEAAFRSFVLVKGADHVFRAVIEGLPAGTLYGYRCWGPNWVCDPDWQPGGCIYGFRADVDAAGHRFNPNKLLIDPYARELSHDREHPFMRQQGHHAGMYGSGPGIYAGFGHAPQVRRAFDTAPWAPKSVVVADATSYGVKPCIEQKDTVIYEAHVRGLTRHPSTARLTQILAGMDGFEAVVNIPDEYRGTYRGAAMMAPYLQALGVTTIEFLPVHETANDLNSSDVESDRTEFEAPHGNYWGYMTYGYFAPDRRYAFDRSYGGPTREFKSMVRAFHEAGLEVYIDVVYNHSAEGGLWDGDPDTGELLSLRGLDNASYYALTGSGNRYYWESTGCGNNLDCSNPAVQQLICDSLQYWTEQMGVDGFRFDLATVLGRDAKLGYRFRGGSALLQRIAQLGNDSNVKVIAEAWDTSEYNVGAFPEGWAEWNGGFRDVVRGVLKGDLGLVRPFMDMVNGDFQHFLKQGGPHKSVNFICAHDGFTLLDLVSYNAKHNAQPWPFGPSDGGADDNTSWDSNGDHSLRRQRLRNFAAIQVFSRGVPMLVGGDEYGRTQNGNNNPYKIDSVGTWQNFAAIATNTPTAIETEGCGTYHDNFGCHTSLKQTNGWFCFVRHLLLLRREHVALRQDRYADFTPNSGDDVSMLFRADNGTSGVHANDQVLQWYIDGSAVGDCDFLLLINMDCVSRRFCMMAPDPGSHWKRIGDTASWAEPNHNLWDVEDPSQPAMLEAYEYWVHPHSIAMFQQRIG